MAITSAIMQMRRGEEEYFDPDKMHPGEWAVSTDTKYVRMCFSPGVCVRMATYEAFEEDMEQIIAILEEAKTVQEAIEKIYEEFQKAELDIEAAENSAILSESYAHGGTGTREGEDTDNAKYYAEKAKENIEPVMNAVYDIALNRQTLGYTKKNLLKITTEGFTSNGITISVEDDGKVVLNGTATADISISVGKVYSLKANTKYIFSGLSKSTASIYMNNIGGISGWTVPSTKGFTPLKDVSIFGVWLYVKNGAILTNESFYPMIRSADITDDTFEPYVDDVNTRLKELTPVNNLLTTVPGSPLDAVMGTELNNKVETLITNNVGGNEKHELKICSGGTLCTFNNGKATITLPVTFILASPIVNILGNMNIGNTNVKGNQLTVECGAVDGTSYWVKYIVVGF